MYVGVRAGGGIGDEIEDPAGDPYELYRILFDITFFFFVIVILLAIIQGKTTLLRFHQPNFNISIEASCMFFGLNIPTNAKKLTPLWLQV